MPVNHRLFSLWSLLLLMAALFPAAPKTHAEKGARLWNRGKAKSNREPQSQNHGPSKHGLKWAGAAAAGILGGTGTGYSLGFLGKTKTKSGSHYGTKTSWSDQQKNSEGQGRPNQTRWRSFVNAAAPCPIRGGGCTFTCVLSLLVTAWIRDI